MSGNMGHGLKMLTGMLLAAILLFACTAAAPAEEPATTLAETAEKVLPDAEELEEMLPEDLSDLLGIEPEEYTDMLWLAGDGTDGREVLVLRAADDESAGHIFEALTFYLTQRLKETRNYFPEAYQLLSAAEVVRKNNTVALIVGTEAADETALILAGE